MAQGLGRQGAKSSQKWSGGGARPEEVAGPELGTVPDPRAWASPYPQLGFLKPLLRNRDPPASPLFSDSRLLVALGNEE